MATARVKTTFYVSHTQTHTALIHIQIYTQIHTQTYTFLHVLYYIIIYIDIYVYIRNTHTTLLSPITLSQLKQSTCWRTAEDEIRLQYICMYYKRGNNTLPLMRSFGYNNNNANVLLLVGIFFSPIYTRCSLHFCISVSRSRSTTATTICGI